MKQLPPQDEAQDLLKLFNLTLSAPSTITWARPKIIKTRHFLYDGFGSNREEVLLFRQFHFAVPLGDDYNLLFFALHSLLESGKRSRSADRKWHMDVGK